MANLGANGTLSLTWNGEAVKDRARQAQITGINRTMGGAVNHAKANHRWQNRTATLEGGIGVITYAVPNGDGVTGTWGVHDVRYALIRELGGVIVPKNAKALKIPMPDGSFRFVKKVVQKGQPYLRPAADAQYPSLADNIRKAYEKSAPEGSGDE